MTRNLLLPLPERAMARYPKTITLPDGARVAMRLMTPADRDAVLAFARSLPEEDLLFLRVDLTQPEVVDDWMRNTASGHSITVVATDDTGMVGYATVPGERQSRLPCARARSESHERDLRSGARPRSAQNAGEHDRRSAWRPGCVSPAWVRARGAARRLCRGSERAIPRSRHHVLRHRRALGSGWGAAAAVALWFQRCGFNAAAPPLRPPLARPRDRSATGDQRPETRRPQYH